MMPGCSVKNRMRGRTNDRIRKIISDLLERYPKNHIFSIGVVTAAIKIADPRLRVSAHRAGRLLSESADVRNVDTGLWEVVR